ncbi:anaerobic ribonucleoside-triphosphate reductase [Peptococcaceae bacterium 1198_IL3148]
MTPKITVSGTVSQLEIDMLLKEEQAKAQRQGKIVTELVITEISAEELEVKVVTSPPIKRVRRITGYLAETDRFNSAKHQELKDRVTHM